VISPRCSYDSICYSTTCSLFHGAINIVPAGHSYILHCVPLFPFDVSYLLLASPFTTFTSVLYDRLRRVYSLPTVVSTISTVLTSLHLLRYYDLFHALFHRPIPLLLLFITFTNRSTYRFSPLVHHRLLTYHYHHLTFCCCTPLFRPVYLYPFLHSTLHRSISTVLPTVTLLFLFAVVRYCVTFHRYGDVPHCSLLPFYVVLVFYVTYLFGLPISLPFFFSRSTIFYVHLYISVTSDLPMR